MIQLKLFEDDFKVGDRVQFVSKSLGRTNFPHTYSERIDKVYTYPEGYNAGTRSKYPNRTPKIGQTYYNIDGYYYLTKDLKKVV